MEYAESVKLKGAFTVHGFDRGYDDVQALVEHDGAFYYRNVEVSPSFEITTHGHTTMTDINTAVFMVSEVIKHNPSEVH